MLKDVFFHLNNFPCAIEVDRYGISSRACLFSFIPRPCGGEGILWSECSSGSWTPDCVSGRTAAGDKEENTGKGTGNLHLKYMQRKEFPSLEDTANLLLRRDTTIWSRWYWSFTPQRGKNKTIILKSTSLSIMISMSPPARKFYESNCVLWLWASTSLTTTTTKTTELRVKWRHENNQLTWQIPKLERDLGCPPHTRTSLQDSVQLCAG